jgi:large subunit ribosomal protein L35
MPKQKTHKGAAKRFKVTKRGKIQARKPGYHHKLIKKSASRKRQAKKGIQLEKANKKKVKKMLGV